MRRRKREPIMETMNKNITKEIMWKEYYLKDIFDTPHKGLAYSKSQIDDLSSDNGTPVLYITRTENNNATSALIKVPKNFKGIEQGNAIVIGDTTATVTYQKDKFICGDHIVILRANWLNQVTGFFIKTIIEKEKYKYSYGRAFNIDNILNSTVYLPTLDNSPNWEWVGQYMKSLTKGLNDQMNNIMSIADGDKNIIKTFSNKVDISAFKAWLKNRTNISTGRHISFRDVEWKYFKVGYLFDIHPTKMYKNLSSKILNDGGNTQFVVNSSTNNGIGGFSSLEPTEQGDIITYSDTTDGNTFFYHDKPFIGFAHVQGMYPKGFKLNHEIAMFLISIFNFANKGLYDYNRKFRRDKFIETEVLLPKDINGNPNWEWIEQYIKSLPYSEKKRTA